MSRQIDYEAMTLEEFFARSARSQKVIRHKFSNEKVEKFVQECTDAVRALDGHIQFEVAEKYNEACLLISGEPVKVSFDSVELSDLLSMPKNEAFYFIKYFISEKRLDQLAQELKAQYSDKSFEMKLSKEQVTLYNDYYEKLAGWSLF